MRPHYPTTVGMVILSVLITSAPIAFARRGGVPQKQKSAAPTARMIFQSLYAKADTAFENKDLDGYLAYHDPDFVEAPPKGDEIDLGEVRYRLSTWLDLAKTVHASTSVVSASVRGTNSTVMVKSNMAIVMTNPDTRAKAYFVNKVVSKDSWTHRDDGWMLLRSQVISEYTTNNGHKVYDKDNPFAPAPNASDSDDGLAPEPAPDMPAGGGGQDNSSY